MGSKWAFEIFTLLLRVSRTSTSRLSPQEHFESKSRYHLYLDWVRSEVFGKENCNNGVEEIIK